ncbi:hypothetical protein ACQP1V_42765 (plasmid) [Microtetraspora malaysiensis]|uniref:hypothetical protein n=1 Tax=Microtetraspora malaysiensis TaxID=161358 RepID=UPI003D90811E
MYDLRLIVYSPNGPRRGVLPYPLSTEAGWPLDDVPSLKLSYSTAAARASLLESPCEVAVEWSDDGLTWTEEPDSRFLRIVRRGDGTDVTGLVRYELPGYVWQLKKVVLYPGTAPLVDGKRAFLSATPGEIMQTYLAEAKARGSVPGLSWDFTPTHDSAGRPWSKILTIYYAPGLDALTCLINLAEQAVLDFRTSGRTLQLYNPDTVLERDLATGPAPVALRYGRDVVEAPDESTLEDVASSVLVVGDAGLVKTFTNPAAVQPWGPWETYVGHGGVSDEGTATILAQSTLDRAAVERVQRTRGITVYGARRLPWRDYRPGDRVLAPGAGGRLESLRVRQITLARSDRGVVGGSVVLNDRFLEKTLRLARRTAGIVGGSTADGGSGARPAPEAPEPRTPAAPAGLIVDPQAYIDTAGVAQGQVTATWGAVIVDVSGVALTVGGYELFMRVNEVGAPWLLVATTEPSDTSATYSPLPVGAEFAFKVRAVNLGKRGPFSAAYAVTIPDDVEAPPVPSAPQLATRLGQVRVAWDGLGAAGEVMPPDYARTLVWMQDPLAPGWVYVGYLESAGAVVVPGLPYGKDRQFRLTSVDRSGNQSAPSTSATIATVPLVQGDAGQESITTGNLVANAVTADKLAVGAVEAGHIAAAAVTAGKLEAVLTLATRIVAGAAAGARVELNSSGLVAYNASGAQTVQIAAASGAVSIVGQLSSGMVGNRVVINPAGAANPEIRFYPSSGGNYSSMYSDASRNPGQATLMTVSGTNTAGNAAAWVIHAAELYSAGIYTVPGGSNNGGLLELTNTVSKVGHVTGTTVQEFDFSAVATKHFGRWSWSGSRAGLVMAAVAVTATNNAVFTLGEVLISTPLCVAGVSINAPDSNFAAAGIFRRSTVEVTVVAVPNQTVTGTFMLWAWQM